MQKMKKKPEFMEAFIKSEERAEFLKNIKKSENPLQGFMDKISLPIGIIDPGKVHLIPS